MYTDKVIDHFTNPRNVGEIDNADGVGEKVSSSCGDRMKVFLKVGDGIIQDIKFQTYGCGAAIASSSMMTEMVIGKTIDEALALTNAQVAEALDGLPAPKLHCSNLAADALHEAIKNYRENQG
jgi:nitrogen fixation NifU-like protein